MQRIKKILILAISLTLSLQSGITNLALAEKKDNKTVSNKELHREELFKNNNWQQLVKIWKSIHEIAATKAENKTYELLTKSRENAKNLIDGLKTSKLITVEESEFLEKIINSRIRYLEYAAGIADCYYMIPGGVESLKKREDLEKRYEILDQIFKENKINTETFEKTKAQIADNIIFLEANEKTKPSKNCLDLLIYLNQ